VAGEGPGASAEAASALAVDIATGRVRVEQPAALVPQAEEVPDWTAAVLNRGTPGFAVDSSGAMNVSLLRACTGWPSGVWIDPPRRWAPDGSAFELEHWSHVYEHALVLGRGDWRQAGVVKEALSYNRPLMATVASAHDGELPATTRLVGLAPGPETGAGETGAGEVGAGEVVLAALKPAGNPLARSDATPAPGDDPGDGAPGGPADGRSARGITLRCYEAHGQPAGAQVEVWTPVSRAARANLLEEEVAELGVASVAAGGSRISVDLAPGEISTTVLDFAGAGATSGLLAETEVAQPVFSRYWLHNKGAAPLGNQALAVHVHPVAVFARSGSVVRAKAHVASGAVHGAQAGTLELVAPAGWEVAPPSRMFSLAPGAYVEVPVEVRVPASTRPGRRFLAARVVDGAGQVQEDILTIDVVPELDGAPLPEAFSHPSAQVPAELEAYVEQLDVRVPSGASATVGLRLANRTAGEIRAEVQLVSPFETWPFTGPFLQGVVLAPGQELTVGASVTAPHECSLRSWALFKVTYYGRLWYSPAVLLRLGDGEPAVTAPPSSALHA
jgi:hypothetical protein